MNKKGVKILFLDQKMSFFFSKKSLAVPLPSIVQPGLVPSPSERRLSMPYIFPPCHQVALVAHKQNQQLMVALIRSSTTQLPSPIQPFFPATHSNAPPRWTARLFTRIKNALFCRKLDQMSKRYFWSTFWPHENAFCVNRLAAASVGDHLMKYWEIGSLCHLKTPRLDTY